MVLWESKDGARGIASFVHTTYIAIHLDDNRLSTTVLMNSCKKIVWMSRRRELFGLGALILWLTLDESAAWQPVLLFGEPSINNGLPMTTTNIARGNPSHRIASHSDLLP